jgi:hypothetical protein
LKPWVTNPGAHIPAVLELVIRKIASHQLIIDEVVVLPGGFLDRHQVMVAHYGQLNLFARKGSLALCNGMREQFRQFFRTDSAEATVLGGFEFLEKFPELPMHALDVIWQRCEQHRLGNGAYCGQASTGRESVFLINGFVPRLMQTYARRTSAIVVFSIRGELTWSDARKVLVGASDPAIAVSGSLRNEFLVHQAVLGLKEIQLRANGVHLSAGPLEALMELRRFMSVAVPGHPRSAGDFQFGRKLATTFTAAQIDTLLRNPSVVLPEFEQPLFDLTQEMDEDGALALIMSVRDSLQIPQALARNPVQRVGLAGG